MSGPVDRETIVGLQVPLVISGRGQVLERAADQRAREARFRSDDVLLEAALQFRELHARAMLAEARRVILHKQQIALDALTAAGDALARGGESARYDVARQQMETDSHRRELASAAAEARALAAELEGWLDAPYDLHLDVQELTRSQQPLPDRSGAHHPRLLALDAAARASELEERAARRRAVPEPEISGGYRRLQTDQAVAHGMQLNLSIPLTLFDNGSREAARFAAEALTERAVLASERRRITARSRAARARVNTLEAELRKTQNRDGTDAIRDGARRLYAAGEMSIGDLLAAFQAAESAELSQLDLRAQAAFARIELMGTLGTQLDAELDRACSGAVK
ncbi:MAG TPA: TolC family protein [Polyangiaceae bacterium]